MEMSLEAMETWVVGVQKKEPQKEHLYYPIHEVLGSTSSMARRVVGTLFQLRADRFIVLCTAMTILIAPVVQLKGVFIAASTGNENEKKKIILKYIFP